MFGSIVVATDGSESANTALEVAIDLSLKYQAKLYIAHVHLHGQSLEDLGRMAEIEHIVPEMSGVQQPPNAGSASLLKALMDAEQESAVVSKLGDLILNRARQSALDAGVAQVELYSTTGNYANGILDAIDDTAAELVVLGRRGLGKFRQMLIGSVSNKVVQNSGVPVLLVT